MIRGANFLFGGGGTRPYDAEVEYLESTGTQYINTGIKPISESNIKGISLDFTLLSNSASQRMCGYYSYYDNDACFWLCECFGSQLGITTSGQSSAGRVFFSNWEVGKRYKLSNTDGVNARFYDYSSGSETVVAIPSYTLSYGSAFLLLFAMNNSGSVGNFAKMRCFGYNIINRNDETILDLIPVRVGSVGYMYDRVSGQLFGNAGTGAFVVGPDKGASIKGFSAENLLYYWDGIDNLGTGDANHSTITNVWKDLVSGAELSLANGVVWGSNNLARGSATGYWGTNTSIKPSSAGCIEADFYDATSNNGGMIVFLANFKSGNYYNRLLRMSNVGNVLNTSGHRNVLGNSYSVGSLTIPMRCSINYNVDMAESAYINGSDGTKYSFPYSIETGDTDADSLVIGCGNSSGWVSYTGKICSIRIYSQPLTTAQRSQNYAASVARFTMT